MLGIEGGMMNSEDRGLLGFAAKAIGYELHVNLASASQLYKDGKYVRFWNPLRDDGDALRLAVNLNMRVDISEAATSAFPSKNDAALQWSDGDPYASTRRAIVRAAAEIGRNAA